MAILELKDVCYKADKRLIIDHLDLTVKKGEKIAVVGPSGSGKSTLFHLLCNLISPTSGHMYYNGKEYDAYEPETLRQRISYMPQETDLFDRTIGENLAFPSIARNDKFDKDRALKLLSEFGLGHYDLDTNVEFLSGGERQRICLARQLMYIPDVLLLDEATSALDADNTEKAEDVIFGLAKNEGVSIMWITHSYDQSMSHFDRRVDIVDGKVNKDKKGVIDV
ncbi:ABC transporter ATP-binding protein [Staphylococcus simulans]|uniref:ABC transporter ATP-binding protein n=1 Tax=Staphylococcus simulans TaxID=1286 RepID=UPI000D1F3ACD|nr:ATP-binding cassette domain-containing protein [Staphylococcus simulans]MDY5061083.1 ATP-binding cassette domain-containing protein [Staphylococcus simulans]PTJ19458.1 methionine ABC transporter ATP-binding protein [Staphylococcus simulans]